MNRLKKISFIALMTIIILTNLMNITYATISCKTSLEISKEEYKTGEEFDCYIKISDISTTKGIIAIGGKLEYDKNSLSLENIKGEDEWSNPTYNDENGKLISFRNSFAKQDENVFKITFKVKYNSKGNTKIQLKEFEVSDGNEETTIEDFSKTIKISEKTSKTENVQNSEGKNTQEDAVTTFSKEESQEKNSKEIAEVETESNNLIWYIPGIGIRNNFLNNHFLQYNKTKKKTKTKTLKNKEGTLYIRIPSRKFHTLEVFFSSKEVQKLLCSLICKTIINNFIIRSLLL